MKSSARLVLLGVAAASVAARPTPRATHGVIAVAETATVRLAPDSVSGVRGVTSVVAVRADMGSSGKSLGSYTITLVWDSTIVRLDSVRAGDFGPPLVNYVSGGEIRLTQVNTGGRAGAFSLAQLHYRFVSDSVGRRSTIVPSVNELTATDFADLRTGMAIVAGVARVLPPTVVARFSPDSIRERVGFKYQIDLVADLALAAGVTLGSYAARVTWDSTIMRLDSVRAGDYVAPQTNQPNAAELRLTAVDAQGRGGAPFALGRLFFRFVNDSFPRLSTLTVAVTELYAARSFANLLPGLSARNGKALIGGVLRGDVDVSGTVAALDAQVILQGVVGLPLPAGARTIHGDADCDTLLRARDAQIVLNLVVGNDVSAFCAGRIQ